MSTEIEICQKSCHEFVERNSSERIYVVTRLTEIQTTSRQDHIWHDAWTRIGKAQRREKQEWAIEKPKLGHARYLRGDYSIDPSDEEYKNPLRMQGESWKHQRQLQCHVKERFPQACIRETVVSKTEKAKASEAKTRFSCITEAHESTRQRKESVTKNTTRDKGRILYCITI